MMKEIKAMKREFRNKFNILMVTVEDGTKTLLKDTNEKCEPLVDAVLEIHKKVRKVNN